MQRISKTENPPDDEEFAHVRSFGWLRRSELERVGVDQVWETPEGDLYVFPPPSEGDPVIVRPKKVKQ